MLQTQRLILRRWKSSDYKPFAQINADAEVMKYFPAVLSKQESNQLIERIENHHQMHQFGLWAVEEKTTSAFIGFVGLNVPSFSAHFTPTVEIGWRLARPFWGQGYATEGAKAAINYGFEVVKLPSIVSFTSQLNLRSIAVMQRLGMTYNPAWDFDHPRLPSGHPLQRHVLYRVTRYS
ncbi:MAG TPA: GNAT family N-acetyltransferase [Cyanothece sp. UBA12306]|nr:GNAT family N-acetyltransferase [Cyanothece sp. UBA12306]